MIRVCDFIQDIGGGKPICSVCKQPIHLDRNLGTGEFRACPGPPSESLKCPRTCTPVGTRTEQGGMLCRYCGQPMFRSPMDTSKWEYRVCQNQGAESIAKELAPPVGSAIPYGEGLQLNISEWRAVPTAQLTRYTFSCTICPAEVIQDHEGFSVYPAQHPGPGWVQLFLKKANYYGWFCPAHTVEVLVDGVSIAKLGAGNCDLCHHPYHHDPDRPGVIGKCSDPHCICPSARIA